MMVVMSQLITFPPHEMIVVESENEEDKPKVN